MTGINPITAECLACGRSFETEFVSLMGKSFLADRYCVICREEDERTLNKFLATEGRGLVEEIAVVKEVTRKNIEPRNGADPFTLFEISAGDRVWTTSKQEVALSAHSLVGKTARITGTAKQKESNGRTYVNYYLNTIEETDASATTVDVFGPSPATPNGNGSTTRDEHIWRQTATKVAANLADSPTDFWQNVDILMNFYRTGEHPNQEGNYAAVGSQETGFQGDDDIPF